MRRSPWALPRQPFSTHIPEIRRRLMVVVAVLIVATSIGYVLRDPLLTWLTAPLQQTLYYTSPGGGLALVLQISLTFGVILTIPVTLFHLVRFVGPVLPPRSRLWLFGVITSSFVLALVGMAAALFISLPTALRFLEDFGGPQVQPLISTDRYFSFVLLYVGGFAVLFQLPLLLVLVNQVVPLSVRSLMTKQRWVVLGSFIVAALLTPTPDPMNQALVAIPMIGLYQIGIGAVWVANRPRHTETLATGEAKVAMLALAKRRMDGSWYGEHEGRKGMFCRWVGIYQGERKELLTFVYEDQHQLVTTSDASPSISQASIIVPNMTLNTSSLCLNHYRITLKTSSKPTSTVANSLPTVGQPYSVSLVSPVYSKPCPRPIQPRIDRCPTAMALPPMGARTSGPALTPAGWRCWQLGRDAQRVLAPRT